MAGCGEMARPRLHARRARCVPRLVQEILALLLPEHLQALLRLHDRAYRRLLLPRQIGSHPGDP
jgi:hypothetical protein